MIKGKKVLAIIPARGGSKRLPRKNVLPLQGKPLIAWSIDAGLNSRYVDRVVVSTDCNEIADISKQYGADVPFMRPEDIAGDTATTNSVILHMINALSRTELFDIVVILQPTSPLRTSTDIDDALDMLETKQGDGVVSVCECEHSPLWSNIIPGDDNMGGFIREDIKGKRSQDLPTYYRLNGAVYAFTTDALIVNQGISYSNAVFSMKMPALRSVDIDNELDFKLAEVILNS
ncbi:cytidylyltransferase domain-containing protein [Moritella sp. Urea-trap-13]|uniref:acylneuraminate cytidylyltransferase family protein n=1 Tax=Moritella sp. Urea-trap-13 TaxID=2058327 RepID=UPI000C32622C|nr:acylneuraminate cytidylyltransferase family protein [Moritella sp. Urea-trap-13]PKH05292.1 CMP-N-acetlyneuraminic acid synthetase [Moritella sp. Urea-trap-13]